MLNIDEYINPYREKLKEIYDIQVLENQTHNSFKAHWNYIQISLKSDYSDYDFFHEYTHLQFLTEEGAIKYPYPIGEANDNQDFYTFGTNLTNIVYDTYVDSHLSECYEVPNTYFVEKIQKFKRFLQSERKIIPGNDGFEEQIRKSIKEYILVLQSIVNKESYHFAYVRDNSIVSQRKMVNKYLDEVLRNDEYEWITYHTLYIREHS